MRLGLAVAALVALCDQLSKFWVLGLFQRPCRASASVPVAPFLNLALTLNRGMSFGLFNADAALNAAIFTVVAARHRRGASGLAARTQRALLSIAIGLVIGGAIGNVIDRLVRGAVVDFLDFHLGEWHWFVFNLADAAISVGVALMVIDGLRGRREAPN